MAASVEAKGKSVDEAIFNGLHELGLGIDEVDIEIIEEGGKRLFGRKPAIVRMTERTAPVVPEIEIPAVPEQKMEERRERRPDHRKPRPSGDMRERSARGPREGQGRRDRRRPDRDRKPRREAPEGRAEVPAAASAGSAEQRAAAEVPVTTVAPKAKLLEKTDIAQANEAMDFLNEMFRIMEFDASVRALDTTDTENLRLKISGEDTPALIGRRGDTLDALQYLTGLVVNKDSDAYIRVMLDAEDYREKREQTLQQLAKRLAANVIKSGRPARLEPMNPYERRILHAALQDNPQVETYSEGVDPNRRVVIRKKRGAGRERRPR